MQNENSVFKHEFSDCLLGFGLISSVQIERTSSFSNQSNAFSKRS
jgi:hypothetical protein